MPLGEMPSSGYSHQQAQQGVPQRAGAGGQKTPPPYYSQSRVPPSPQPQTETAAPAKKKKMSPVTKAFLIGGGITLTGTGAAWLLLA